MILDLLSNHAQYHALHPFFAAAFQYLETSDPSIEPGRYELSEKGMYVLAQAYLTKPVEGSLYEAHREYIDIQYILEGCERIYYAPITYLQASEYQPEKDYLPLQGNGQPLLLHASMFAIFFPQDAHLPSREITGPELVKKIVVKIPLYR